MLYRVDEMLVRSTIDGLVESYFGSHVAIL